MSQNTIIFMLIYWNIFVISVSEKIVTKYGKCGIRLKVGHSTIFLYQDFAEK